MVFLFFQSTSSEEPPSKTNVSKPNSVAKVAKTATVPSSDCEAKVAARQKEMKGKVRSKKSVHVRMTCAS